MADPEPKEGAGEWQKEIEALKAELAKANSTAVELATALKALQEREDPNSPKVAALETRLEKAEQAAEALKAELAEAKAAKPNGEGQGSNSKPPAKEPPPKGAGDPPAEEKAPAEKPPAERKNKREWL